MATFVCSDIHGRYDRYLKLVKKIKEEDTLYILGDVIDRGPDGVKILKDIMTRKNVILLCGNHEDFMYSFLFMQRQQSLINNVTTKVFENLDTDTYTNIWFAENNGGLITYDKFLMEDEKTQMEIFKFLSKLPMIVVLKVNGVKYHLSHAGILPRQKYDTLVKRKRKTVVIERDVLDRREIFEILWSCPYKMSHFMPISYYPKDCTCIFGHVPVQRTRDQFTNYKPLVEDNTICIDGGCAFSDVEQQFPDKVKTAITCICLDTMKNMYIR